MLITLVIIEITTILFREVMAINFILENVSSICLASLSGIASYMYYKSDFYPRDYCPDINIKNVVVTVLQNKMDNLTSVTSSLFSNKLESTTVQTVQNKFYNFNKFFMSICNIKSYITSIDTENWIVFSIGFLYTFFVIKAIPRKKLKYYTSPIQLLQLFVSYYFDKFETLIFKSENFSSILILVGFFLMILLQPIIDSNI